MPFRTTSPRGTRYSTSAVQALSNCRPRLGNCAGNDDAVTPGALPATLDALSGGNKEDRIFLRADRAVHYGDVMQVMNDLRSAGYLKIALVALETREAK